MDQSLLELPSIFAEASQQIENVDYFMERIESGKITVIPAHWIGHGTSIVILNNILCRNNSGECSYNKPGITIFEMHDKSNLRWLLKELLQNDNSENASGLAEDLVKIKAYKIFLFNNLLISSLKLTELCYLPKNQKVGNCTWVAGKMAVKCTLILKQMQKSAELNIQNGVVQSKPLYDGWVRFDSLNALITAPRLLRETAFHPFYKVGQAWTGIANWASKTRKVTTEEFESAIDFAFPG